MPEIDTVPYNNIDFKVQTPKHYFFNSEKTDKFGYNKIDGFIVVKTSIT